MKFIAAVAGLIIIGSGLARATEEPRILEKVTPLPVVLSKDFEFRKTKLFFLSEIGPKRGQTARQTTSALSPKALSGSAPSQKTATLQDAPITFERQYRLFGAVTKLDQHNVAAITSISFGAPSGQLISQCVWSIARRNCTNRFRRRKFLIETCAALTRQSSRSLVTIILTTGE